MLTAPQLFSAVANYLQKTALAELLGVDAGLTKIDESKNIALFCQIICADSFETLAYYLHILGEFNSNKHLELKRFFDTPSKALPAIAGLPSGADGLLHCYALLALHSLLEQRAAELGLTRLFWPQFINSQNKVTALHYNSNNYELSKLFFSLEKLVEAKVYPVVPLENYISAFEKAPQPTDHFMQFWFKKMDHSEPLRDHYYNSRFASQLKNYFRSPLFYIPVICSATALIFSSRWNLNSTWNASFAMVLLERLVREPYLLHRDKQHFRESIAAEQEYLIPEKAGNPQQGASPKKG